MEIILSILGWAMPLILSNNLLMSVVKYLSVVKNTKVWLRSALVVLSLVGVIASSALSGNPIDFNQISDLGAMLVEALALAVGSHYTYKLIKTA